MILRRILMNDSLARDVGVVLFAGGSFNPPTLNHLRMFESSRDYLRTRGIHVAEGILSPVSDGYQDMVVKTLVGVDHRLAMCELAVKYAKWIRVDSTECMSKEWTPTVEALRSARERLRQSSMTRLPPGVSSSYGCSSMPRMMFLCGADLVETFSDPDLWDPDHVREICSDFGLVVITRSETDPVKLIQDSALLTQYKDNIFVVPEIIVNNISSTVVRELLAKGESVRYLVPDPVIEYIYRHRLYNAVQGNCTGAPCPHSSSFLPP